MVGFMTDHQKAPVHLAPAVASAWQRGYKEGWDEFAGERTATAIPTSMLGGGISAYRLKERQAIEGLTTPEHKAELEQFLATLSSDNETERYRLIRKWMVEKRRELEAESKSDRDAADELQHRSEVLRRLKDAYEEMVAWSANLKLEKSETSVFRDLRRDCAQNRALHLDLRREGREWESTVDYEKEYLRLAEVFVVQHDWAAAFSHADDMKAAPFKLPYETCAFEFRISGRSVIALATEVDERIAFTPATHTSHGWFIPGFVYFQEGDLWIENQEKYDFKDSFEKIVPMIGDQIRAICIALDAEVATTTLTREPHSGQHNKNSYTVSKPYHVVSLARRARAVALESSVAPIGRKKRLHFRRGHWRHFSKFKTWIRWCLVGDPDLGFVDKEYRL
jgi:hypothetical protein